MLRCLCILALCLFVFGEEEKEKQVTWQDVVETCKKPFVTENFDPSWEKEQGFNENSTIFIHLTNKAEIFRLTQNLYTSNEFDDFKDTHLTSSCIRFKRDVSGSVITFTGFNGKSFVRYQNPILSTPYTWHFLPSIKPGFGGRVYTSLSDNKAFTVLVTCHDDGLGSFIVVSPNQTIQPESLEIVKEHVKALGFKEDHFVYPNNELECEGEAALTDVPVPKNLTMPIFLPNLLVVPGRYHPNVLFALKK